MNPILPIVAARSARAATIAVAFQIGYRLITGRKASLSTTLAANLAISAFLCVDIVSTFWGPWSLGYPDLHTKIPRAGRVVALTFDDGPTPDSTPATLQALDNAGALATFFLLSDNVRRYPELLEMIKMRGHAVAIHGIEHVELATRSASSISKQIRHAKALLGEGTLPYFRPPYGFKSLALQRACVREGVVLTTWSINPKDYTEPSADVLIERVMKSVHPGGVILLHEWSHATQEALPRLVGSLRASGYELVRMETPVIPGTNLGCSALVE